MISAADVLEWWYQSAWRLTPCGTFEIATRWRWGVKGWDVIRYRTDRIGD